MARQRTQLVILCEDLQQEVFIRHLFISCGFHRREIRIKRSPQGKGAGEQYVRKLYPQEVRLYRGQSTYRSVCLAVVIDADTHIVEQRLNQLDLALEGDAQQRRQASEKIALFIPKRNIETWIHYLSGAVVDEETSYPKLSHQGECKPYVEKFVQVYLIGLPDGAPPSLHTARNELKRIV